VFLTVVFVAAVLSAATAAVAGFGIGSVLTPLMAAQFGMTNAVAAVSIPHVVATAMRCWRLRRSIDWRVVRSFGLLSAAGGLAGAALYTRFSSATLGRVLGALLIATAIAGLTNWVRRAKPNRVASGLMGFASGAFGGVAGNQGGLRAAALMAFSLVPAAFVATSTATGLLVDAARMPVYVAGSGTALVAFATPIGVATAGVVVGTFLGERVLLGLSIERFRQVVSALIGLLGAWMLMR
jgi:uncharacterized membrane protein YfcA